LQHGGRVLTSIRRPQPIVLATDQSHLRLLVTIVACAIGFYFVEHSWDTTVDLSIEAIQSGDVAPLNERVESGSLERKLAFPLIGFIGVLLLLWRGKSSERPTLPLNYWMFLIYAMWTCASIIWSADAELTIRRLVVFACIVSAAIGFRERFRNADIAIIVVAVVLLHLAVGVAAEVVHSGFPFIHSNYRFAGTVHPNTQAVQLGAAGIAVLCLFSQSRRKWLWGGLYVVIVLFVYLTRSRTALASLMVASACITVPRIPQRYLGMLFLGPAAAISLIALSLLLLDLPMANKLQSIIFLGRVEETATLTGRTAIWSALFEYFSERPFFGFGYGGFWTPQVFLELGDELGFQPAHAHSAYLQTLLDIGLIGFAMLAIATIVAVFQSGRYMLLDRDDINSRFFFGLFIMGLLFSGLDTNFVIPCFVNLITFAGIASCFRNKKTVTRWQRNVHASNVSPG